MTAWRRPADLRTHVRPRELTLLRFAAILTSRLGVRASFSNSHDPRLQFRKEIFEWYFPVVGWQRYSMMNFALTDIKRMVRRAMRLTLVPLLQAPEEALMGGQAVIEGVMMRSPHSYAVAVRQPNSSMAVKQAYLDRPSDKHSWLKYPILRGLGVLGQALDGILQPGMLVR